VKKVVIRFKDGEFINVEADYIEMNGKDIVVWNDDNIVAITNTKEIVSCHMSVSR
jgi:hypothetical protein